MRNFRTLLPAVFTLLLITSCSEKYKITSLPRSSPEAEGISSEAIMKFVEAADKNTNEIHSYMLMRHGRIIAEGWWNPYRPELKHTMYSLSKSFVSTAVGFAVSEKLLHTDDKVISFFPYEIPETLSVKLAKMTVKDLLIMSAGQDPDPTFRVAGTSGSWVKTYLNTPVINDPGSKFLYNSLATFMLSAIVQKATGKKVIDYLKPRFFEPLGISGEDWEENGQGINTGGWGLRLKTEDIARAGQFYLQKGKWNGQQLLPSAWIEEATTAWIEQNPGAPQAIKDSSDWMQGYGYQFWRCRNNAFRGDGAYGQYMIIMPQQDAVLAITSETLDMQKELNLVWKYLLPAMGTDPLPENDKALTELRQKSSSLALPAYSKIRSSPLEKDISGKTYFFGPNKRQIDSIRLEFQDTLVTFSMKKSGNAYLLNFKRGEWNYGMTELQGPKLVPNNNLKTLRPFRVAGSCTWLDNNSIEFTLRYIESPHTETITCIFLENRIGVSFKNIFNESITEPLIEGALASD
jgi:CubicO group peptidase (beta-lactamase class C family)